MAVSPPVDVYFLPPLLWWASKLWRQKLFHQSLSAERRLVLPAWRLSRRSTFITLCHSVRAERFRLQWIFLNLLTAPDNCRWSEMKITELQLAGRARWWWRDKTYLSSKKKKKGAGKKKIPTHLPTCPPTSLCYVMSSITDNCGKNNYRVSGAPAVYLTFLWLIVPVLRSALNPPGGHPLDTP